MVNIREKASGPEHPDVVNTGKLLVNVYLAQSKYDEVESIYKRLITIKENSLGTEHPDVVAEARKTLARFYQAQGRYADAESIYKRLITIKEASLGAEHPDVAEAHKTLARFYQAQGRYADAESIYKRQLELLHGFDDVRLGIEALQLLLRNDAFVAHALLREKASARQGMAESLDRLAQLYDDQGRHVLAEVFRNRSWESSSPYCYRSESNTMIVIAPKWRECPSRTVFATRSEHEEWKASKAAYREKFRRRVAVE